MTAPTPPASGTRPYATNEARFEIPTDWEDQTVHIFAAVAPDAPRNVDGQAPSSEFSLVLHRDTPREGESLDDYVTRQLAAMQATLPAMTLVGRGDLTVGGTQALDAEFRWTADQGLLHQRQVFLRRHGRVLTATGTAPERLWAKYAPAMDALLASWRFQIALVAPPGAPGATPA